MAVVAETADADAVLLPQLDHHERQVKEGVERVVADEEDAAISGDVLDAVRLGLGDEGEGCENRREPVHLTG